MISAWWSRMCTRANRVCTSTSTPTISKPKLNASKGLGATMVDGSFADHPGKWVIMADPTGKEFCVVYALNPLRPQADRDAFERKAKAVS